MGQLPKGQLFIVTSTLRKNFGGRTKSLLQRARLLTRQSDDHITLVTTNYNPDYQDVYDDYRKTGKVNNNISFLNIYDDLKGPRRRMIKKAYSFSQKFNEKHLYKVKEKNRHAWRFFDSTTGSYVMFKCYDEKNDTLKFIDFFKNGVEHRFVRELYDRNGFLHQRIFYFDQALQPLEELFYDFSGRPYLNKTYRLVNGKSVLKKIFYFDHAAHQTHTFNNEKDFFTHWFNQITKEKTYMIVDARLLDRSVLNIENDEVVKIFQLHNNHVNKPEDPASGVKKSYQTLFDHIQKADAVVCLTEEQANDIKEIVGHENRDKIRVIPHCLPANYQTSRPKTKRNLKKIVVVARLDPQKRLDDAIKAFHIFSQSHDGYTLEIYGEGQEYDQLTALIKQLGLENKCFLKGFTDHPDRVFQSGVFSIVSSRYEGFALTVLESLHNGCPVVSYDVKYGPAEMIKNGYNGYLAENAHISDLADKMSRLIAEYDESISEQSIQSVQKYNEEAFIESWRKLLNEKGAQPV